MQRWQGEVTGEHRCAVLPQKFAGLASALLALNAKGACRSPAKVHQTRSARAPPVLQCQYKTCLSRWRRSSAARRAGQSCRRQWMPCGKEMNSCCSCCRWADCAVCAGNSQCAALSSAGLGVSLCQRRSLADQRTATAAGRQSCRQCYNLLSLRKNDALVASWMLQAAGEAEAARQADFARMRRIASADRQVDWLAARAVVPWR